MALGKKKDRGVLGKVIVFLLAILSVIGLIAMSLSVISPYFDPHQYSWMPFFGLAFWEIFIANVLIFVLLLVLWSRTVWIVVVTLAVSTPGIIKSYSFGTRASMEDSLKVMSYNVHMFDHVDGEVDRETCANQVINLVREQSPDVLCCQEFNSYKSIISRPKCIEEFASSVGLPYVYYNSKRNYAGNVIFSKYPVEKVTEDSGFGQENTYGVMVSVDAGQKGYFYLANVHLLSYKITDSEINKLMNSAERHNSLDTIGMTLYRKLKLAFVRRSEEISNVLEGMPPVEGPVIVCGDFNETPMSYVYRRMQKAGFTDTFTKVGHGIKPTYAGQLPLLRIDYVWATDDVTPLAFERIKFKASDHYPIVLDYKLKN